MVIRAAEFVPNFLGIARRFLDDGVDVKVGFVFDGAYVGTADSLSEAVPNNG